jgi:hypothetical protein
MEAKQNIHILSKLALVLSTSGIFIISVLLLVMPKSNNLIDWDYVMQGSVLAGVIGVVLGLIRRDRISKIAIVLGALPLVVWLGFAFFVLSHGN